MALVATAALAGCARFDAALGQRQAVVSFRDGTPVPQRLTVRSTCAKVPAVTRSRCRLTSTLLMRSSS